MPSPEEILRDFRDSAGKEADKDPVKIDVAAQGLEDLLSETDPTKLATKAYDLMQSYPGRPSVGAAVCSALLRNGEVGLEIGHQIGKQVMRDEIAKYSPAGGGFIRGQHSINGFSKQFIQETSPECEKNIKAGIGLIKSKYKFDELTPETSFLEKRTEASISLGKEMVSLMANPPMTEESMRYLKGLRDAIGEDPNFVEKYKTHKGATDEEAREELEQMAEIVTNNATTLRFTSPLLATDDLYKSKNQVWIEATKAAQLTFSKAKSETLQSKPPHSTIGPKGEYNELTPEEIEENEAFVKVQTSVHESRDEVLRLHESFDEMEGVKDSALDLRKGYEKSAGERQKIQTDREKIALEKPEVKQVIEERTIKQTKDRLGVDARVAKEKLPEAQPHLDKVTGLEAKLDRLKKEPSNLDKFKAFFKGGFPPNVQKGLEKMREETIAEIDKNKMEAFRKTEPEKFDQLQKQNKQSIDDLTLERQKVEVGNAEYRLAEHEVGKIDKTLVLDERLAESGINAAPLSQEERQNLKIEREVQLGKMQDNQKTHNEHEQHKGEVENLKKNVKVRDIVGSRPEVKAEGNKQKLKTK